MVKHRQTPVAWHGLPWDQRLQKLHEIAHDAARINEFRLWVVNEILKPAGVPSEDFIGQARAIHDWAKRHIYYVNEAGEHLQHPLVTREALAGDCDDFSLFIAAASHSIGLPYRYVLSGEGWEARLGDEIPDIPEHIHVEIGTPALVPIDESSHVVRTKTTYRSADATNKRGHFGDRVSLAGLPRKNSTATLWMFATMMLVLVLIAVFVRSRLA